MHIDSLVIETTRRCNMACEHCLRGDAESIDLDLDYVEAFLRAGKISSINNITFSGGEPSLVPNIINGVFSLLEKANVEYYGFYVATNGKQVSTEFLCSMIRGFSNAGDYEEYACSVELSNDDFHDEVSRDNLLRLRALSFFREKYNLKDPYGNKSAGWDGVIYEGRGEQGGYREPKGPESYEMEKDHGVTEGTLYLNCHGQIVAGCAFSYDRQREDEDVFICNADKFNFELLEEWQAR